jgi:chaperone modulatory protein CbpM
MMVMHTHRETQLKVEWAWMDAGETNTLHELSECCGMDDAELKELVDYSALIPIAPTADLPAQDCLFSTQWVHPLREVGRMRSDFDLDLFTVALLLGKMSRIELLERELRTLKARLPTHLAT